MAERDSPDVLALELDLTAHAPSLEEVSRALAPLLARGYEFFTLAQAGNGPDARRRLYELVREGVLDDPGGDGAFMTFQAFDARLYEPYYARWAASQFLSALGGEWVGLVNLQPRTAERAEQGITVVRRPHRGQGIARALKLLSLRHAHDSGIRRIVTRNHVDNVAMIALNRSLGFRPVLS